MADQWKTYTEAAEILGLTLEGVRQRARREAWRKTLGNDGKARVMIPGGEGTPGGDVPGDRANTKKATGRLPAKLPPVQNSGEIDALRERIAELRQDLERGRGDLDRERAERLQAQAQAERLSGELADALREIGRVAQESAARERDLRDMLDAQTRPSSGWWPFRKAL